MDKVIGGDQDAWCRQCGMHLHDASEYHPYAACLMYMACGDRPTVLANLNTVLEAGKSSPSATVNEENNNGT